jgi:hypothetical protein
MHSALLDKLGCEAVTVSLVLGLQLLQGPEQLPGLARVVADALALGDEGELALLVAAAVPDGLLGLLEQSPGH